MTNEIRTLVDATTGGSLMGKNIEDAHKLLEKMATNAYQWPSECNTPKKTLGSYELDVLITLSSQVASLSKQVSSLFLLKQATYVEGRIQAHNAKKEICSCHLD